MDEPAKPKRTHWQNLSPLPPRQPSSEPPPELPSADDAAEERSGGGHGWRGLFSPQAALVATQNHRQAQQASALQSAADAAFGSVAALDADTQLSVEQRALGLAFAGLALWRHCTEEAPFRDESEFRAWLDNANADLKAIAATLAAHRTRPALDRLPSVAVRDSRMLAVAAERTPPSVVHDYWQRLGTTSDDKRPGVFLSYAHVDLNEARELKTALGPEVLVVLDDDYLRFGETWWDVLGDAITYCKATLVLVSPQAVASRNVKREISTATNWNDRTDGRHLLVPVILLEVPMLPMPLQGLHGIFVQREGGLAPTARKLKAQLVAC